MIEPFSAPPVTPQLFFTELVLDKFGQLFDGLLRIFSFGFDPQGGSLSGLEGNHLHDAFTVHAARLRTVFVDGDGGGKLVGQIHELHRRPGVQAQGIGDDNFTAHGSHGNTSFLDSDPDRLW